MLNVNSNGLVFENLPEFSCFKSFNYFSLLLVRVAVLSNYYRLVPSDCFCVVGMSHTFYNIYCQC